MEGADGLTTAFAVNELLKDYIARIHAFSQVNGAELPSERMLIGY